MAEALDDSAFDLARRVQRVDHAPDVVDRDDLVDADLARLDVDGHFGELHSEREDAHARRVRSAGALAEDLAVLEQTRDLVERPRAAVGRDDAAVLEREDALLEVVALRGNLDDLAGGVVGGRAYGRTHAWDRRRAGRDRGVGAARGVAERDLDVVGPEPELLRCNLRHRRPRPGADVLHGRDHRGAAVRADADPRVRRRPAAAEPDLAREADPTLPRAVGGRAQLLAPCPMPLGPLVAVEQVLGRERPVVDGV